MYKYTVVVRVSINYDVSPHFPIAFSTVVFGELHELRFIYFLAKYIFIVHVEHYMTRKTYIVKSLSCHPSSYIVTSEFH